MKSFNNIITGTTQTLSKTSDFEKSLHPCAGGEYPSIEFLSEFIHLVRCVIFPNFYDKNISVGQSSEFFIGHSLERMFFVLSKEICNALKFNDVCHKDEAELQAKNKASAFIESVPKIKSVLLTDVHAIFKNDPAVIDYGEIILCYPGLSAMLHYRVAHELLYLGVPVLPRMLTEMAHSQTGIDINPGAVIGEYFAIDHGTGVVIGETSIIGNHCTIYQGVTLGAKKFTMDADGKLVNVPRHPILEDNVTVYSNSTILGRITVGHDSIIGGNVWLTDSVAPYTKVIQNGAVPTIINDKNKK